MRKPFYEEDFNVEEYVNNKILEMDSISDRILYKQMAESFMIDLFDMTRKEISKISKSVIDELERKEEKIEIYTSVIENSKYDKTDTFLCPIYETEKRKDIDIVKIQETLSNGELYCLDSIYIKEKYSKLIQIKENNTFDGKIETTEGIYDAVFEINFDNRCLNKLKEIYKAFMKNAVMYNTLCIAHLIRMYTLSIKEIKSDNVKGDFVKYKIDYKKLNVLEDIIPLWNIREVKEKTSAFPIGINGSIKYEHIVLNSAFYKNSEHLVANTDVNIYFKKKNKHNITIACDEMQPREWLFYEFRPKYKIESYEYKVLSNIYKSNLADLLQNEYKSKISTYAQLQRVINQNPYNNILSLEKVGVLDAYSSNIQSYSMSEFLNDEIVNNQDKKILLLTFKTADIEEYLVEDFMSYITTIVQEYMNEYHCIGKIQV